MANGPCAVSGCQRPESRPQGVGSCNRWANADSATGYRRAVGSERRNDIRKTKVTSPDFVWTVRQSGHSRGRVPLRAPSRRFSIPQRLPRVRLFLAARFQIELPVINELTAARSPRIIHSIGRRGRWLHRDHRDINVDINYKDVLVR